MNKILLTLLGAAALAPAANAADIVFQAGTKATADNLPAPTVATVGMNTASEMLGQENGENWQAYYSDYAQGNGRHATYTFTVDAAGVYDLDIFYANMQFDRYIYAKVNDAKAALIHAETSGDWNWENATAKSTMRVALEAGENTITIEPCRIFLNGASQNAYLPNIYKFELTKAEGEALEATKAIFVEAEDCDEHSAGLENRPNFSHTTAAAGTGVGLDNGNTASYTVNVDKAGAYLMRIWYCTMQNRDMQVEVDGYLPYELNGVPGYSSNWDSANATVNLPLYLEAGANKLTFKGHNGYAPIVDCFEIEAIDAPWFTANEKLETIARIELLAVEFDGHETEGYVPFNLSIANEVLGEGGGKFGYGYDEFAADRATIGAKYTFEAPKAGVYTLTAYTACAGERAFFTQVNDQKPNILRSANNGTWDKTLAACTGETSVKVWLNEGVNTFVLARHNNDFMPGIGKFVFLEDANSTLQESDFAGARYFSEAEAYYFAENCAHEPLPGFHGGQVVGFDNEAAAAYYTVNVKEAGMYQMRLWHKVAMNGARDTYVQVLGKAKVLVNAPDNATAWDQGNGIASTVLELKEGLNIIAITHGTTGYATPVDCFELEPINIGAWYTIADEEVTPEIEENENNLASAEEVTVENFENAAAIWDNNEYNQAVATAPTATITKVFDTPVFIDKVVWASTTKGKEEWTVSTSADAGEFKALEGDVALSSRGIVATFTPAAEAEETARFKARAAAVKAVKLEMTGDEISNPALGAFQLYATPDIPTGVADAIAPAFTYAIAGGELTIAAEAGNTYAVYTLAGAEVAAGKLADGTATVTLAAGLYILKVENTVCKIVIR
ncbi:MAG: hypothetical protein HDS65_07245 [Bacteroidales bacterium]|nr:hypothetical protein [Bacteroidales bacterium]